MTLSSSDSYTDLASTPRSSEVANPLAAGLPALWWPCVWGFGSLVYSLFWMAESWKAAQSLIGPTKVNYFAQDLWCLILVLGSSYAVHQFCRHRSERLGLVLCLLMAAAAMTWHRL
ncbi:hypothetical protein [Microvirga sp. BSC39]|uniref:hypothetical protein n=1 Tax=Microvirga sp. BSC39 TaxID=1549810 RepID=UPI0004E87FB0|nr:hypothetical protein [Microvirga sp. BSC39]KFG69076.1 hypothetical protein JH26_12915 [Microvirga sp. BSC39]